MSHHHDDVPLRVLGWCAALQLLGAIVGIAGVAWSHSYSLFSDLLHWLADVVPATTTLLMRAWLQHQRRNGHHRHFGVGVSWSGAFNALTLGVAGAIAVHEASQAIHDTVRVVYFWPACIAAIIGFGANWYGHRLTHVHSHAHCATDTRFDVRMLDEHLKVDIAASGAAIGFLLLNAWYGVTWLDTAGGLVLGWSMIGYAVWLLRPRRLAPPPRV